MFFRYWRSGDRVVVALAWPPFLPKLVLQSKDLGWQKPGKAGNQFCQYPGEGIHRPDHKQVSYKAFEGSQAIRNTEDPFALDPKESEQKPEVRDTRSTLPLLSVVSCHRGCL